MDIRFEQAAAQALPFPEASLDVTFATLMLHHLGRNARSKMAHELRRVIRPGGRALVVDFATSTRSKARFLAHFRHGHGRVALDEIVELLGGSGFDVVESGPVGVKDLHFALGTAPCT